MGKKLYPINENDFDFSVLWSEEEEGGMIKFVPVFNSVLLIIAIIVLIMRT